MVLLSAEAAIKKSHVEKPSQRASQTPRQLSPKVPILNPQITFHTKSTVLPLLAPQSRRWNRLLMILVLALFQLYLTCTCHQVCTFNVPRLSHELRYRPLGHPCSHEENSNLNHHFIPHRVLIFLIPTWSLLLVSQIRSPTNATHAPRDSQESPHCLITQTCIRATSHISALGRVVVRPLVFAAIEPAMSVAATKESRALSFQAPKLRQALSHPIVCSSPNLDQNRSEPGLAGYTWGELLWLNNPHCTGRPELVSALYKQKTWPIPGDAPIDPNIYLPVPLGKERLGKDSRV